MAPRQTQLFATAKRAEKKAARIIRRLLLLRCGVSGYMATTLLNTGAGERSRTLDLLITNELLYQLSYTGEAL
jgi:hypothetical protein